MPFQGPLSASIGSPTIPVTGSLMVTGSLLVSASHGGSISGSIHHTSEGLSYLVAGANTTIVSGTSGQITISSTGGGGTPAGGDTEVQFNDGGSAFGAETTFTFNKTTNTLTSTNLTGSLTKLSTGISYLKAGVNVTIVSASSGQVTISSIGDGSGATDVGWIGPSADNISTTGSLGVTGSISTTGVINRIGELGNKINFETGQVLILSGGSPMSANAPEGIDVNFYVSGSVGSRNSSTRGTTIFGGDVVVSGTTYVGHDSTGRQSLSVYGNVNGDFVALIDNDQSSNGHVLKLQTDGNGSNSRLLEMEDGDGDTLFRARADGRFGFGAAGVTSMGAGTFVVGIDGSHTADIAISKRFQHLGDSDTFIEYPDNDHISVQAGGRSMIEMLKLGSDGQVLILSGGSPTSPDESSESDVALYISGSRTAIGGPGAGTTGRNAGTRTNTIFGGDVVFSGSIYGTSEISPGNPALHLKANTVQIDVPSQIAVCDSSGNSPGFGIANSPDVFFGVSGSAGGKGGPGRTVSVFGGDTVISGSLYVSPESDLRGIVIVSQNGTKYMIVVDNAGNLSTVSA